MFPKFWKKSQRKICKSLDPLSNLNFTVILCFGLFFRHKKVHFFEPREEVFQYNSLLSIPPPQITASHFKSNYLNKFLSVSPKPDLHSHCIILFKEKF